MSRSTKLRVGRSRSTRNSSLLGKINTEIGNADQDQQSKGSTVEDQLAADRRRDGHRWYRVSTELYRVGLTDDDSPGGWTVAVWDVYSVSPGRAERAVFGRRDKSTATVTWNGRTYDGWISPIVKSRGPDLHAAPVTVGDMVKARLDLAKAAHARDVKKDTP